MGRIKNIEKMQLNQAAQLAQFGIRLENFSKLKFGDIKYSLLGTEFIETLKDIDFQQATNRYIWEGLPEYLNSEMIEASLYHKGSLAGFFYAGTLYILPYSQTQGVNVYGQSNAISPLTDNGALQGTISATGLELIVNNLGRRNNNARAAILYDRTPRKQNSILISRAQLNNSLIEFQCDIMGRIKNNLRNIDKKCVFYANDEQQAKQMKLDLREAYGTTDPFIVIVKNSMLDSKEDRQTLQGQIDSETQSLFETWQSVNSIRCMALGITNGGAFEKKERKITGELQGDQTQTDLILDAGLRMRKLFLLQLATIYPEYSDIIKKIKVRLNEKMEAKDDADMEEGGEGDGTNILL